MISNFYRIDIKVIFGKLVRLSMMEAFLLCQTALAAFVDDLR